MQKKQAAMIKNYFGKAFDNIFGQFIGNSYYTAFLKMKMLDLIFQYYGLIYFPNEFIITDSIWLWIYIIGCEIIYVRPFNLLSLLLMDY